MLMGRSNIKLLNSVILTTVFVFSFEILDLVMEDDSDEKILGCKISFFQFFQLCTRSILVYVQTKFWQYNLTFS